MATQSNIQSASDAHIAAMKKAEAFGLAVVGTARAAIADLALSEAAANELLDASEAIVDLGTVDEVPDPEPG